MGFDIVFGIILFVFVIRGYRRGFAESILFWAGLVIAFMYAEPVSKWAAPMLSDKLTYFPEALRPSVLYVGSIVAIWLAIYAVVSFNLSVYRRRIYGENTPSYPDRMLGTIAGAAQAAIIISVLTYCWTYVPETIRTQEAVKKDYDASRGVKLANEYHIVDRVMDAEQVQKAWEHVRQIANHYRSSNGGEAQNAEKSELELRM